MVFLLINWVISDYDSIQKHEELERKLISCYRRLKEVKSFMYFSHWAGQNQSAVGGRLEILEFKNLADIEKFFEALWNDEEASQILNEKLTLINPATVRFSFLYEKNRELWFKK